MSLMKLAAMATAFLVGNRIWGVLAQSFLAPKATTTNTPNGGAA